MFLLCQILLPAGSEASSALLTPIAREAKTPESLKLKASKEAGKKKTKTQPKEQRLSVFISNSNRLSPSGRKSGTERGVCTYRYVCVCACSAVSSCLRPHGL